MFMVAMILSVVALGISALAVGVANSQLRVDELNPGPWRYADKNPSAQIPSDLNSIVLRIDRAKSDPTAWENLLRRLDALHIQLSPFGPNARRPPHIKRRWWGGTKVKPEAPMAYDARYLEDYIAILEQLARRDVSPPAPDVAPPLLAQLGERLVQLLSRPKDSKERELSEFN